MAVRTVTTYICDRCSHEWDDRELAQRKETGMLNLHWTGSYTAYSYNGDCGGGSVTGKSMLCLDCQREFLAFMHPRTVQYNHHPLTGEVQKVEYAAPATK